LTVTQSRGHAGAYDRGVPVEACQHVQRTPPDRRSVRMPPDHERESHAVRRDRTGRGRFPRTCGHRPFRDHFASRGATGGNDRPEATREHLGVTTPQSPSREGDARWKLHMRHARTGGGPERGRPIHRRCQARHGVRTQAARVRVVMTGPIPEGVMLYDETAPAPAGGDSATSSTVVMRRVVTTSPKRRDFRLAMTGRSEI
jgi:hypothetical protein